MAKPGALVKRGRGAVMPPPLTVTQLLLDVSLVRLLLAVLGVAFRPLQVSGPRRLGALARPVPRLLSGVGSPRIACYAGIERGAKKRNRAAGADTPAVRAPAPSCPRAPCPTPPPPHPHPQVSARWCAWCWSVAVALRRFVLRAVGYLAAPPRSRALRQLGRGLLEVRRWHVAAGVWLWCVSLWEAGSGRAEQVSRPRGL